MEVPYVLCNWTATLLIDCVKKLGNTVWYAFCGPVKSSPDTLQLVHALQFQRLWKGWVLSSDWQLWEGVGAYAYWAENCGWVVTWVWALTRDTKIHVQ